MLWHCRVSVPNELNDDHIGRKNRQNPAVAAPPGRGPALFTCALVGAEHRQSANAFADRVRAEAEAELQRLLAERALPHEWNVPQRAD